MCVNPAIVYQSESHFQFSLSGDGLVINLRILNVDSVHRFAGSSVDELLGVGHVSAFNQYMSVPLTAIAKAYRKGSLQLIHLSIPL